MEKFIIEPFFSLIFSNEILEKIKLQTDENTSEKKVIKDSRKRMNQKGANSFIVVEPDSGESYPLIPLIYNDTFFGSKFPNPIHLYFNQAYENFKNSEKLFSRIAIKSDIKSNLIFVEFSLFNSYIESKIASIIFLHATIEAFINHIIPEDFAFKFTQKNNEIVTLEKNEIVRRVNIKTKLVEILPLIINSALKIEFSKHDIDNVLQLISARDELIHLKIKKMENNLHYHGEVEHIVNLKINNFLNSVINIINQSKDKYLKFESENKRFFTYKLSRFSDFKTDIGIFLDILNSNEKNIKIEIPFTKGKDFPLMRNWVLQNLEVMRDKGFISTVEAKQTPEEGLLIIIEK